MIILIGGQSHTGKTILAQTLLEKYRIPYVSLDHIKMGLCKTYPDCGFTPTDNDDTISEKIWPFIKNIIDVCEENRQNIILEGVYLSPEKIRPIISKNIAAIYIVFSKKYIETSFQKIKEFQNIIEKRKFPDELTKESAISDNSVLKQKCIENGLFFCEIESDYEKEILAVYKYIDEKIFRSVTGSENNAQ